MKPDNSPMRRTPGAALVCWALLASVAVGGDAGPRLVPQTGGGGLIADVAYSSDGRLIITGSWGRTAVLWEAKSGRQIRTFRGHWGYVTSVAFSPDDRFLVTGSTDRTIRLWDVRSGQQIHWHTAGTMPIDSVEFSPDGKLVLVGDVGGSCLLFDLKQRGNFQQLSFKCLIQGENCGGHSRFSPDGKFIVAAGARHSASVWDVATQKAKVTFAGHTDSIRSVAWSPDGSRVATGSADETARLWDAQTGRELQVFQNHSGGVFAARFSSDGSRIVTSDSRYARIWNTHTGEQITQIQVVPGEFVNSVIAEFSPNEDQLLATMGGIGRLYDVKTWQEIRRLDGGTNTPTRAVSFPDSRRLLVTEFDFTIWDTEVGRAARHFADDLRPVLTAAVSNNGKLILTGGAVDPERSAGLWDAETGELLRRLPGHALPVAAVALSSDGQLAATAGGNVAGIWETSSGRLVSKLVGHEYAIRDLEFSPDDRFVITASGGPVVLGGSGGTVRIWDARTREEVRKFNLPIGSSCVAWSADGGHVAAASTGHPQWGKNSSVQIWRTSDFEMVSEFQCHERIRSVAFSPDSQQLAVAIGDNTVRVLDVASSEEAFRLKRDSVVAESVTYFPDGRFIVTAGNDGTILWSASDGHLICQLVTFADGGWVVADSRGRFDASNPDLIRGLNWTMTDDPLRPLPVEIFMRDYYEPRLLSRLLAGEVLPDIPDVSTCNRVQPTVEIVDAQRAEGDTATVWVKVYAQVQEKSGNRVTSGMQNLHLFRDGQLVGFRSLAGSGEVTTEAFRDIRLPHTGADKVEFTAYAFNDDGVKSETTEPFDLPVRLPPQKGRAYVVTVGVDAFEKHQPHAFRDLRYAARDAIGYAETLGESLLQSDQFTETVVVPLISEHGESAKTFAEATTGNIEVVFDILAGRDVEVGARNRIRGAEGLRPATPDDLLVITFSTHGFTCGEDSLARMLGGQVGEFYLAPADIGKERGGRLLDRCISGEQLARWLRDVDAGELVMIVDACQSAGATGHNFKPGPMGSRGLGQMAYNKRMRILAASQVTQAAEEDSAIGHGLLSFALLDGLTSFEADVIPTDGKITLGEWLKHGEQRVPQVADSLRDGSFQLTSHRNALLLNERSSPKFQQPVLFDFSRSRDGPVIRSRLTDRQGQNRETKR